MDTQDHKNNSTGARASARGLDTPLVHALAVLIADADRIPVEQVTLTYVRTELRKAQELATRRARSEGKEIVSMDELRRARETLQERASSESPPSPR